MPSSIGPTVVVQLERPIDPVTSVGPTVVITPVFIDDTTIGPTVVCQPGFLVPPLPIRNFGPRLKQIQRRRNDTTVPASNDVLGSTVEKGDWISPGDLLDFVIPSVCGGRITTGTSMAPGDPITGGTTGSPTQEIWYVPYAHNLISLYDGTNWNYHRFDAFNTTIESASIVNGTFQNSSNYDVYVYDNGGTLALEYAEWSTHTPGSSTRNASFQPERVDGVLVGNFDNTRRYVGTLRTDTSGGTIIPATENSGTRDLYGVWNYYNQVKQSVSLPLSISGAPSYATTGGPTQLTSGDTPTVFVSGYPSQLRYSFTLKVQMISSGGAGTIDQVVPDYRARTGCSLSFDNVATEVVGWRPLDTLGSTSNSQDRVIQIGKCGGRFFMSAGAHEMKHFYDFEQLPVPDVSGSIDLAGNIELEIWR